MQSLQVEALYLLDQAAQPSIGCVATVHRRAGLSILRVHGECLCSLCISEDKRMHFYQDITTLPYDVIELNLPTHYSVEEEISLRRAGFLRPVGLFSTNLSKQVSTGAPLVLDKSWRRNTKKADESGLIFRWITSPTEDEIAQYCAMQAELRQRKGFQDEVTMDRLRVLLSSNNYRMAWVLSPEGELLSGGIIYAHPTASTFLYSFTTPHGRELSASYPLYTGIISHLGQEGIETFDLGRLSPAQHAKNNLFLFKDGIGGEYLQYMGEWQYCRRSIYSILLYLLKKHYWKLTQV